MDWLTRRLVRKHFVLDLGQSRVETERGEGESTFTFIQPYRFRADPPPGRLAKWWLRRTFSGEGE